MSVIWQGLICEELHGMGSDLSENGSADTDLLMNSDLYRK